METKQPLSILSLNTNGLGEVKKRQSMLGWLKNFHNAKNKIIFLQETHTNVRAEAVWKAEWKDWDIHFSHGATNSKGTATFLPKNLEYETIEIMKCPNGRYVATILKINGAKYCLINCYAPTIDKPKDQQKWLKEIQLILQKYEDSNIIVGGDLNDYFIPHLDKYNCKPRANKSDYVKAWDTICDELNMTDVWRTLNPETKCYTWRQGSSATRLKQSRLDYWLVSTHLMYDLHNVDIKPSSRSDHSLIDLDFHQKEKSTRGPSFWNFNSSLLRDKEYVEKINICYANALEKYNNLEDKGLVWDLIKMEIRSTTICFSKNKSKDTRAKLQNSMLQTSILEKEINNDPTDEKLSLYNEHKKYIGNYNNERANGAIIRSRVDWAEFGEKNSKFFLNLEKRNHNMKCITKLINDNKEEITEHTKILEYEQSFYEKLYSVPMNNLTNEEKTQARETFIDTDLPRISEPEKESCEHPISIEEIGKALKELKNGKAPGTDGFTPDFYKFFWILIKSTVLDSLKYAYEVEKLSIDQRRGVINLIPKKSKDPRLLKNWRPISLLNTDYKIITKVLANRLKKVLPSVINPDQVAYLKNRFIGQNIRTIIDIMGYTKLMDKNGIIAFLDFEKAFDTINWDVIYDALNKFNIGPNLIKWVQTIYKTPEACVTNNGFSSPFFTLQRGVRQGCPLSAYLFIMVVELLAHKIRISDEIKGIKIGDTEIKLVQMADDTTTFIEDENSLENILKLLDTFEKYAGLKLNKTKTEAMWIGKNRNNQHEPLQITWVKQVHALGIFFSYDNDSVILKNFMDRAKEFKKILDMWLQRDLSLIGKITVLKSLAFSKVLYQCGVMDVPDNFIDHLNDLAYDFLWNSKPNKIKRITIISDYEDGGLKMLDIKSFLHAQKAMWVKRLLSPDTASWKAIPMAFLDGLLGRDTFKCNMECKVKPLNFPEFYWNVLEYWFSFKELTVKKKNAFEVRRESLWLNKNIKVNENEIRGKTWERSGIHIIHDILNENGTFLSPVEIENKYQIKCNIMKYNTLKEAIPMEWRKTLKTMKIPPIAISNQ
jgi:exonuclease III